MGSDPHDPNLFWIRTCLPVAILTRRFLGRGGPRRNSGRLTQRQRALERLSRYPDSVLVSVRPRWSGRFLITIKVFLSLFKTRWGAFSLWGQSSTSTSTPQLVDASRSSSHRHPWGYSYATIRRLLPLRRQGGCSCYSKLQNLLQGIIDHDFVTYLTIQL